MIEIEKVSIHGLEETIRGMRNSMNSCGKSDSGTCKGGDDGIGCENCAQEVSCEHTYDHSFQLGKADHDLLMKLAAGGSVHARYRWMITVYLDITAPLYWWKEFDTYKVGTVANSCSTMHKIQAKEFTLDDFSYKHLLSDPGEGVLPPLSVLKTTIDTLNTYRALYVSTNTKLNWGGTALSEECCRKLKKDIWWQMIQLLPSSYNEKRTVMLNYEVLASIYPMQKDHELDEWREFCQWIEQLPYSEIITCNVRDENNA